MIELERDDAVFVLRMRDGENKLNRSFLDAVNGALDEVESSEGEAALVTTGAGRFYSTGLDLGWLATCPPRDIATFLEEVQRLFARLLCFPVATVAAINGHAYAAGALLALAHDFRLMRSDKGFVCLPEIDLKTGRPLTPGMYAVLDAKLPRSTVHEALVTARRYGGPEAVTAGFVNDAVSEGELLPRAVDLARGLAAKDRATLGAIKRGLYAAAQVVLAEPLPEWLLPELPAS